MNERSAAWLEAARVYLEPRVIAIFFLGFASGLPLLLTLSTLSVWLKEADVSLTGIGLFALVGLPYSLKFLWSPLVDRLPLPLLTKAFGRRRGWCLLTQGLLIVAILGLGGSDPVNAPFTTAAWALAVAFASASQDIVIDALRVEVLEERQYGAGAAMVVAGYRLGLLVAGAGALFLAEALPWPMVYGAMAACVGVGILTILLLPEPGGRRPVQPVERGRADPLVWLREAVLDPLLDFLRRPGCFVILAFVLFYKLGDSLIGPMANPFYLEMGFSKSEIAEISKLFGLAATLIGGFAGGLMVARFGIMTSLLVCGVLQMGSNLMFAGQALAGHSIPMLIATIGVENIAGGMGTAAFVAYLSSLCNVHYTATQYALLSSLMAVARTVLSAPSGAMAASTGWVSFFVITTVAALPGLLLWYWLKSAGYVPRPRATEETPP